MHETKIKKIFQEYTNNKLEAKDCKEIEENLKEFFLILLEWSKR